MTLDYQIKHFCDECPYCETYCGVDDAYGAPMVVSELTCDAEGDPTDLGCPERGEYMALLEERDEREKDELRAEGWTEAEINGEE